MKLARTSAALSLVGTALVLLGAMGLPGRAAADVGTPSNQLTGAGESWPEAAVRALQNGASAANALGGLEPVYTAGRGDDPARQDLADGFSDFAVSEGPLTTAEATTAQQNGITAAYVPYALGGVAILAALTVDHPHGGGLISNLKLTIPTLAKLFTHQINYWNDPEILAENPDIPNLKFLEQNQVLTVVRRDSSATSTALVATFLANPTAKSIWEPYAMGLGQAKDATPDTWPADTNVNVTGVTNGEKGMIDAALSLDPVTEKPVPGVPLHSIAYVATSFAQQFGGPLAAIQNGAASPKFVLPTDAGALTAAAASGGTFDASTNLYTFDYGKMTDPAAYPIPLASYWIVPVVGDGAKAAPLSSFIRFVLGSAGQAAVNSNGMVGLPAQVLTAASQVLPLLDAEATTTTTSSTSTTRPTTTTTTGSGAASGQSTTSTIANSTRTTSTGGGGAGGGGATTAGGGTGSAVSASRSSAQLPFTGGRSLPIAIGGLALIVAGRLGRRRTRRQAG